VVFGRVLCCEFGRMWVVLFELEVDVLWTFAKLN
jgi:hypothetical protein